MNKLGKGIILMHDFQKHTGEALPVLLARLASRQLEATLEATRDAWRTLRRDVRGQLPPDVVEAAMTAYETEGARFAARVREVAAVTQALAGRRWIPGAGRWAEN